MAASSPPASKSSFAQATDDGDGLADQLALQRHFAALQGSAGLRHPGQAAFHQHLDQAMRAGIDSLSLGTDILVAAWLPLRSSTVALFGD